MVWLAGQFAEQIGVHVLAEPDGIHLHPAVARAPARSAGLVQGQILSTVGEQDDYWLRLTCLLYTSRCV